MPKAIDIPEIFYRGDSLPVATTVGQLQFLLNQLPKDLPVNQGFGNAIELAVYNVGSSNMYLGFEEAQVEDG